MESNDLRGGCCVRQSMAALGALAARLEALEATESVKSSDNHFDWLSWGEVPRGGPELSRLHHFLDGTQLRLLAHLAAARLRRLPAYGAS